MMLAIPILDVAIPLMPFTDVLVDGYPIDVDAILLLLLHIFFFFHVLLPDSCQ